MNNPLVERTRTKLRETKNTIHDRQKPEFQQKRKMFN